MEDVDLANKGYWGETAAVGSKRLTKLTRRVLVVKNKKSQRLSGMDLSRRYMLEMECLALREGLLILKLI